MSKKDFSKLRKISDEVYEFKENRVYLFCADQADHEELDHFSRTLSESNVNAIVSNYTFSNIHEFDLEELVTLRDAVETVIEKFYRKVSAKNPDRFEILRET